MKFEYTPETDTLYIEFRKGKNVEGEDINARTVGFYSDTNELVALEIEHAKKAVDLKTLQINGKIISAKALIPAKLRKKIPARK